MVYQTIKGIPYSFYRSFANTEAGKRGAYKEATYLRRRGDRSRVTRPSLGPAHHVVIVSLRERSKACPTCGTKKGNRRR